jgi:hypothetical protein
MRFAANCEWQCHLQLAEGGGWGNASYTFPKAPRAKMATCSDNSNNRLQWKLMCNSCLSSSPLFSGLGQYPSFSYRSARIKPFVRERPSDHSETL